MSTEVIAGWLKDNDGNKFAPKTLASQVINDDGKQFIPVINGGTGATTAVQALANLKALNLDVITDNEFIVPSGADLNTYTTPGAYRIGTATIVGSLLNAPSYKSAGGRLIVTATSSTAGCFQFILYNTVNYQVWFRIQTSTGTWGEWELLPTSNHMPDYVVAEGTSGNWSYRKWNSGVAECWHYKWVTPTALSSAAQVLTKGFTHLLSLPFEFVDENYIAVASVAHSNGYGVVLRVNNASKSQMSVTWEGSDEVLSSALDIYVKGYWK